MPAKARVTPCDVYRLHDYLITNLLSIPHFRIFGPPTQNSPNPHTPAAAAMAAHTTRQTASTLLNTSRCLRRQTPAAARLLVVPAARRCMHQEQQPPAEAAPSTGIWYRPMTNRNRAPFSLRRSKPFAINEDPEKLDAMYQSLLGGNPGLNEEIKLQAVTHKSFDHGWQPYNEKLAFFGKCFFFI